MGDPSVPKNHSPGFLMIAEQARAQITEIEVGPFEKLWPTLKSKGGLLLDVREDHEWILGHLPEARHLGRGILERDIETIAPDPSLPLVVYCGGGYRSALAAESLQKMGYKQVFSLAGGYRLWTSLNKPVTKP